LPAFILSAPRSGTTWLVRALGAHPEILASELRAFGDYFDLVHDAGASKPRLRITLDAYLNALFGSHAWQPLGSSREGVRDRLLGDVYSAIERHALQHANKRAFVDKVTPYLDTSAVVVQSIARLFPQASVIHLIRDGRDVAVSGVMHWLNRDVAQMSPEQRRRRDFLVDHTGERPGRFFTDEELTQWASHWRQPIDALRQHGQGLRLLEVRYERMSANLSGELRRMFEFLGVSTGGDVAQACVEASTFEAMSGGRKRGDDAPGAHVRKGVVGDWREHFTHSDAIRFDEIAGDVLVNCGYESSAGWLQRI